MVSRICLTLYITGWKRGCWKSTRKSRISYTSERILMQEHSTTLYTETRHWISSPRIATLAWICTKPWISQKVYNVWPRQVERLAPWQINIIPWMAWITILTPKCMTPWYPQWWTTAAKFGLVKNVTAATPFNIAPWGPSWALVRVRVRVRKWYMVKQITLAPKGR